MRWVIHSETSFEARHALTSYMGKPETPHRHRWTAAIEAGTAALNDEGYALDFHKVHEALAHATRDLNGADLNQHPEIGVPSPSAERVAEVLADRLTPVLAELGGTLLKVSVWEGPDNRVDLNL